MVKQIKVLRDDVMIACDYMVMINSARTITSGRERKKNNPASRGKSLMWIRKTRVKNTDV